MKDPDKQLVPKYVVYCDESCYDLAAYSIFMAIGGLFVPQEQKLNLSREFRRLLRSAKLNAEVKWSKASLKRFEDYKKIIDFFFEHPELRFRSIVVDQTKVDLNMHAKDRELAFYKFYYELLEKWLEVGCEYLILLDYKNNRGSDRYTTLRTYLERHLKGKAWIHDLTIINSKETPLAQLCDVLTGAVAAAYNGSRAGSAKEQLANYIASKLGWSTLKASTSLSENKFNIFRIQLEP
jgi:hypothetical protein